MSALLAIDGIDVYYGASHVLHGLTLSVERGQVVLLLGRNGAGKTTTMRALMGLASVRRGEIAFRGRSIADMTTHRIARLGMGFVPEDRRIFGKLTVRENLDLGRKAVPPGSEMRPWDLGRILALLPALEPLLGQKAGTLSGGQQQMLTVARTLMGNPILLLLDEPAEGLAPVVAETLAASLAELKSTGLSMVISEQNLSFGRALADHAYVLESGYVRHHGTLDELLSDQSSWERYIAF